MEYPRIIKSSNGAKLKLIKDGKRTIVIPFKYVTTSGKLCKTPFLSGRQRGSNLKLYKLDTTSGKHCGYWGDFVIREDGLILVYTGSELCGVGVGPQKSP